MKKSFKILFISILAIFISVIGMSVKAYEYPKAGFVSGQSFNDTVKAMANEIDSTKGLALIKHVVHAESMPDNVNAQDVSYKAGTNQGSIYVWITDDTLYYWSNADNMEASDDASLMFSDFVSAIDIEIDFTGARSSTIASMFQNCQSLKTLDLSNFNTSFVTDMTGLFSGCTSLTSVNLGGVFDTYSTTRMTAMFNNCSSLETLDLSNFITRNVTDMTAMFYNCSSLKSLNISTFNTSSVENMTAMFNTMSSIEELDLRSFSTESLTTFNSMFSNSPKLKTIYATSSFDLSGLPTVEMFGGDIELVGDKGTDYIIVNGNHQRILSEFAHLDGGESNPGFFSTSKSTVTVTFMNGETVFNTKELLQYDRITFAPGEGHPTKTGYTFDAWCSDPQLTSEFDFDTRVSGNITLYARFIKNITFNVISDHGTVAIKDSTGTDITSQGIFPQGTIYITVTPEAGYMFKKMNIVGINGTNVEYYEPTTQNFTIPYYDELTLTATYVELPKVVLAVEEIDGVSPGTITVTDTATGDPITDLHIPDGAYVTFTATPNNGFEFEKFMVYENNDVLYGDIEYNPYDYVFYPVGNEQIVEAVFRDVRNKVYFMYGDTIVYEARVANGDKVLTSSIPTTNDLMGYEVKGWYTTRDLETPFDFNGTTINGTTYIYGDIEPVNSYLVDGTTFNYTMKVAAGNTLTISDIASHNENYHDSNIKKIVKATELPDSSVTTYPVYLDRSVDGNVPFLQAPKVLVWYDNGTIYWYSEAENVILASGTNMFYGLKSVESIDMTGMDTSRVTDMGYMFADDPSLTSINLLNFDTSEVTDMEAMFFNDKSLQTLDLSSFDSSALTNSYAMFYGSSNLKKIFATENFTLVNISDPKTFYGCTNLEGMMGTLYSNEHNDNTYGHLDEGNQNPGYFSENVMVKLTYMLGSNVEFETEVLKGSRYTYNAIPDTDEKHYFNGWYYHYENGQFSNIVDYYDRFTQDTVMYGFIDENNKIIVINEGGGELKFKVGENEIDPANGVAPQTHFTVSATPDDTHKFVKLIVDGTDFTDNTLELDSFADITIEVIFEELPKFIVPEDINGTVTVKDTNDNEITNGHANEGQTISIDVEANDNYKLEKVVINGVDVDPSQLPYNLVVTGDVTIEPVIKELPTIDIGGGTDGNGTVTITDGNGNGIDDGSHVEEGTKIIINVEPKDGYKVVGVEIIDPKTGDVVDKLEGEPPYEYIVNGPIEVNPIYEKLPVITTPDDPENGEIKITDPDGNPVDGYVEPGTPITIDVIPNDGYEVEKVIITKPDGTKVEIAGEDLPTSLIVTGDIDIEPIIVEKKVDITLPDNSDPENKGTVTIKDENGNEITDGKIQVGDEIEIDVTPDDGYVVDKVIIKDKDGNTLLEIPGSELPKIYKVTEPISIEVTYKSKYEIIAGDNQTYTKGSKTDITIKCNGELADLRNIEIDNGNVIDPSNYDLEEGSTILILKSSFLDKQSNGDHTITFNYKDGGSASATLTIEEKVDNVPVTRDTIINTIMIFIISLISLITVTIIYKKKLSN